MQLVRVFCGRVFRLSRSAVARHGQFFVVVSIVLGTAKIPRRDANREQTFVWSLSSLDIFLGYPYMKLNVALAASIAALALMTACSKQEAAAPEAAPAADAAAASADAAASSADAAASSADAAAAAAPADATAAPADAAAAPADAAAPAEAPKQ